MDHPPFKTAIFLDLEGVVVTHASIIAALSSEGSYGSRSDGFQFFMDMVSFKLVCRLAQLAQADIVLTSTLRTDPGVCSKVHQLISRYFDSARPGTINHGFMPHFDVTRNLGEREDEIKSFMTAFGTERYLVIDDRKLDIPNFVRIEPKQGFTYKDYQASKQILLPEDHPQRSYELIFI